MKNKLFCGGIILLFLLCGVSSVFATNAKANETWLYAYEVAWRDTGDVVKTDIGAETFAEDTRNIEDVIARRLGFRKSGGIYIKTVSGRVQTLTFTSLVRN